MRPSLLVLRKDLLVLRRSPALLGVLIAYPLVIALLIGLTAAYANAKPRVALVALAGIPHRLTVAGASFNVDALIDQVAKNVDLVRMSQSQAASQLAAGRVAAVITVPYAFIADLKGLLSSPHLTLATGTGGITPRVRQQMQALVYNLNVAGGEPWQRLPLVAVGVALAGAAVGAVGALIGALAREARSASLIGILVVLPVVFLGLVPHEIVPAAAWVSDAFPFVHAVRFFASALYDGSPWRVLGREAAWLVGLGAAFGTLARVAVRRLAS
jgi:ABC-2 type transport system permease protein